MAVLAPDARRLLQYRLVYIEREIAYFVVYGYSTALSGFLLAPLPFAAQTPSAISVDYVTNKTQFQLHDLVTEQRHKNTWDLSKTAREDTAKVRKWAQEVLLLANRTLWGEGDTRPDFGQK